MTAYVDSPVVLPIILGQPGRFKGWARITSGVASALVEVECLRTLDRLRLRTELRDQEFALRREAVFRLVAEMEVVEPSPPVLARASQPFPAPLGTPDAIHLATALIWREKGADDLVMATHDTPLATAARACGLPVLGAQ